MRGRAFPTGRPGLLYTLLVPGHEGGQVRARLPRLRVPICQGQALWHRGQLPDLRPVDEIGQEGLRESQGTDTKHLQAREERGSGAEGQRSEICAELLLGITGNGAT